MRYQQSIKIPNYFSFRDGDVYNFDGPLSIFDWEIRNKEVLIDLRECHRANYQAFSLLVLYVWHLKSQRNTIKFKFSTHGQGATKMWHSMGAKGWYHVLTNEHVNFIGDDYKPLIAIRSSKDFRTALDGVKTYTEDFDVEYEKTLRYVISELLYNTLEHGRRNFTHHNRVRRLPSIVDFTWYKKKNELHFIIADLGIGVKKHLEQTYDSFDDHETAIKYALEPNVSGTFGYNDPYKSKDNAGIGLFISSNIIRRLNADMHVISENGIVHISPSDVTKHKIKCNWPGTLVLVQISLNNSNHFNLHNVMAEFRKSAEKELETKESEEDKKWFYLSVWNIFGAYAEDKTAAIRYRDTKLIPEINAGRGLKLDFDEVKSAPHSFLSALLATPIKILGMPAYKKIKIHNADPEIRETVDFILDDNTE